MTDETIFSDEEWSLLVGLPQAVLSSASAVERNSTRQTMAEGGAGLTAIADGCDCGSPLVETVAKEILFRVGGDPNLGEEPPVVAVPDDPATYVAETLARAKAARALLSEKVDDGEAGAYRHWLVTIAEGVVEAAPSGGDQVSAAEGRFVHQLSQALND